jgi:alkylation response protein AidB-like acyl-CoA dehydrogenase
VRRLDLDLSSDQEILRDTTARFIQATLPLSGVRQLVDSETGPDASYIRRAAELGWWALLAPEDLGGGGVSDRPVLDAAILAEQRGRMLQPGPFIAGNVVVAALGAAGSEQHRSKVVPGLMSGEMAASWALADANGHWASEAGVVYRPEGSGFALTGAKTLVQDADRADWLLVGAGGPDGPAQFLVAADSPGVTITPLAGLDLTRRFCEVALDGTFAESEAAVGAPGQADELLERQLQLALVLTVAESIGSMDAVFNLAVDYSRDRTAFGRPIGSFQAVKHQLADTSLLLEESKAVAAAAARAVAAAGDDAGEVASMAKAFVGDSGIDLAQTCFQVFGGIGYTWEHDQHLFLRRLTVDASLYGAPSWHRERICRLNGI